MFMVLLKSKLSMEPGCGEVSPLKCHRSMSLLFVIPMGGSLTLKLAVGAAFSLIFGSPPLLEGVDMALGMPSTGLSWLLLWLLLFAAAAGGSCVFNSVSTCSVFLSR